MRSEIATLAAFAVLAFFAIIGDQLSPERIDRLTAILLLILLFSVMLWAAFAVVRHAECLAILLG